MNGTTYHKLISWRSIGFVIDSHTVAEEEGGAEDKSGKEVVPEDKERNNWVDWITC